ncbi:MAG TPA: response regulator [Bryobacterales bacterium]|jgi:PAS domain S-box-containing protein|nr:response regulator [Bryobacterales bacterium]
MSGGVEPVVLVVDDTQASRYVTSCALRQAGFQVREAATGTEALAQAKTDRPEAVILDANLPDISGVQVCRQIKADPETASIAVLHVSAACAAVPAAGAEGGADAYLVAPVDHTALTAILKALLRAREAEEKAQSMACDWEATFNSVHDAVALVDAGGKIRRCNEKFKLIFGEAAGVLPGRHYQDIVPACQQNPLTRALRTKAHETSRQLIRDRWFRASAHPIAGGNGITGAVWILCDITDLRHAEELRHRDERLGALTAALITAQEEERRRLSRELHDSLNQKLCMLAVGVEQLEQELPDSAAAIRKELQSLRRRAEEISDDVRRTAYQLHPSILEHLGLGVALRSYCEEVQKRTGIKIRFRQRGLPDSIPQDVALCFYRVAQEAIQNAAKHSGAQMIVISLRSAGGSLRLTVADSGKGFDPGDKSRQGLGLISMAERVRLVNGALVVKTGPGEGARIDLRVSLQRI